MKCVVGVLVAAAQGAEAYYAYGPIRQLSPGTQALEGHPMLSIMAHAVILLVALVLGAVVVAALLRPPNDT
jgi:hypothetical protein